MCMSCCLSPKIACHLATGYKPTVWRVRCVRECDVCVYVYFSLGNFRLYIKREGAGSRRWCVCYKSIILSNINGLRWNARNEKQTITRV